MRALLFQTNWQLAIAALVAIFTVLSYLLTRRRELAWRRTEFLCKQAEYLENDPVLMEMITILEERHASVSVSCLFDGADHISMAQRQEYVQKMDKLLNFLWRWCYAYLETKTISIKELNRFGWYLALISENPALVRYCDENGFDEINLAIERLK